MLRFYWRAHKRDSSLSLSLSLFSFFFLFAIFILSMFLSSCLSLFLTFFLLTFSLFFYVFLPFYISLCLSLFFFCLFFLFSFSFGLDVYIEILGLVEFMVSLQMDNSGNLGKSGTLPWKLRRNPVQSYGDALILKSKLVASCLPPAGAGEEGFVPGR